MCTGRKKLHRLARIATIGSTADRVPSGNYLRVRRRRSVAAWVVVCAAGLTACAQLPAEQRQPPAETRVTDRAHLSAALRAAGATVVPEEPVRQPFFAVEGRILDVDGEGIQVFEYRDAAAAEAQARLVSADGNQIGTSKPLWVGTPHFFRKGRLLVLYLGENRRTIDLLKTVLGPQFAGA